MIYCDESVWVPVAEGLRRRGWSVTTAVEAGTLGDGDVEQLRYAADQGWPLLTFDDDFLALVERDQVAVDHAGIVFVSQHGKDVGEVVRAVDAVLDDHGDTGFDGRILYA
jgi:hypothetical protein